VVFFDLDNFKEFNDRLGHQEGDCVLQLVGRCAKELLREQDYAFRLGGDEFGLILLETDLQGGGVAAERFRKSYKERWKKEMEHLDKTIRPVTMSLGITQYRIRDDMDSFMKRADSAMYEAKKTGGDRTFKVDPQLGELEECDDRVISKGISKDLRFKSHKRGNFPHRDAFKTIIETRKDYRKKVGLEGQYIHQKTGNTGSIKIEDISLGGIGFKTDTPHAILVNDILVIRFKADDHKTQETSLTVKVRHIRSRRIGAKFIDLEEKQASTLP
jgi:diguanylate cyclase (GGDEF)-like protein